MPPLEDRPYWRSQLFTFGVTIPKPEFWFGECVDFCWTDENTKQPHSETGVVVGVVWNHKNQEWHYVVTWLSSTIDLDSNYPIFSEEMVSEEVLCKP